MTAVVAPEPPVRLDAVDRTYGGGYHAVTARRCHRGCDARSCQHHASALTPVTRTLALDRDVGGPPRGPKLARWWRVLLVAVATGLGALALVLWTAPELAAGFSPFDMGPLGARFAGCWVALLATVTGWAAWDGRVAAAGLPALALVALPAGMLLGAVRTADQLRPAGVAGYVVGLMTVLLAGAVIASPSRGALETSAPCRGEVGPSGVGEHRDRVTTRSR